MTPSWWAHYPPGLPPEAEYPDTPLWAPLAEGARTRPHAIALVSGDQHLSYEALWSASRIVAGSLRSLGLAPGQRVLLCLPNGAAFTPCYFGSLLCGAVVSAATPALGEAALSAQLADVAPRVVITTPQLRDALSRAITAAQIERVVLIAVARDSLGPRGASPAGEPTKPHALAVLQYTSGTTGRAKGAMISQANLRANALQNARWFGWSDDEINLCVLPLCHTWGMCCGLHSTLAVGGTLVLPHFEGGRFDGARTLDQVRQHRATVLYGSATMFHRLLDLELARMDLSTLRHVKAGAMLSQGQLKNRWDAAVPGAPLQQGYGLTEASPESHGNPPHRFKSGTVGVPLQDTRARICDPEAPTRVLGPGQDGEVQLRGPQVMSGYWRRPAATAAAFADGWLRTGDLGQMDDEGYLTITDRLKDLIKFRGWSLSPGAIEEVLLGHRSVAEAVVVGRPDPVDGEIPIAFVSGDRPNPADLIALCRRTLDAHAAPREVHVVAEIPKNHVGKPLRRMLRSQA